MKKQDRIDLAKKCYDRIGELNLQTKIDGNFILISPPEKIPTDLMIDIAKCSEYLIDLINLNHPK